MSKKISACLFLLIVLIYELYAQPLKTYAVKRTTAALIIDGKLNEPDWVKAATTDSFRLVDSGARPNRSTLVKALWDDNYLYIAFIASDSSIWADMTGRDAPLWKRDVAEIFIDTKGDSTNYAEIGIGPNNVCYDYILPQQPEYNHWRINTKWDMKGFEAKAFLNGTLNDALPDSGWVIEIAIPFAVPAPGTFHLPKPGETWRVNFCRIDYNNGDENSARYYAWCTTGAIAFHRPSKFGKLIFDADAVK